MSTQYTTGQYLIDRLKELGAGHMFGVPGDYGFPFLDQIDADPDITWVGNCNEMNAAYAADAYARVRGIGVLTGACGVVDMLGASGVASAYAEHVPLVLISNYPSTEELFRGTYTHHSLQGDFSRFPRIYQEMTAAQALLTGDNACQEIDRVLLACWEQKLPVYIQFPSDVQVLPAEPPAARLVLPEPASDPAQLEAFWDRFVALLNDAEYPVMLVDYPVVRYQLTALIQDVSGKTGIPLAGTLMATSAFLDKTHPTYLGMYPLSGVAEQVDSADLLIRLCIEHHELNRGSAASGLKGPHVVDLQPASASIRGFHYPQVALRDVLTRLGTWVSGRKPTPAPSQPPAAAASFEPKPATAISVDRVWEAFRGFAEQDDVLVVDYGVTAGAFNFLVQLPVRTRTVTEESWWAIGWSLPALLGAHLADRDHRHILVIGDGAFEQTAQELSTILRHGLAPVILLFNNGRYEVENWNHAGPASEAAWRASPIDLGYNVLQSWSYHQLPAVFAEAADPLGVRVTTEEELGQAFAAAAQAQRDGRCALIEVVLNPADVTQGFGRFPYPPSHAAAPATP